MIFDPNPGREPVTTTTTTTTPTTTLDDGQVWQEITRVARAALREAQAGDSAGPVAARLRAAMPAGETWDIRTQPLLHTVDDRSIVVVAIERVVQAETPVQAPVSVPTFTPTLRPAPASPPAAVGDGVEEIRTRFGLSQRQAEVAALLARRLTDKEIASRLGVSRHTARRHVELTMIRLRVHSRAEVGELLAGAA